VRKLDDLLTLEIEGRLVGPGIVGPGKVFFP
jgi:hypothetical protein